MSDNEDRQPFALPARPGDVVAVYCNRDDDGEIEIVRQAILGLFMQWNVREEFWQVIYVAAQESSYVGAPDFFLANADEDPMSSTDKFLGYEIRGMPAPNWLEFAEDILRPLNQE